MPVHRPKDFVEAYRLRAGLADSHEMTGRHHWRNHTRYVSEKILEALDLRSESVLVDVGCGDGTLLALGAPRLRRAIGTAPTKEECLRLELLHRSVQNIEFRVALSDSLPIESESADRVVCNNVFLHLPSRETARESLRELARVCRSDGMVWLGEVPFTDEQAVRKEAERSKSIWRRLSLSLWDLLRSPPVVWALVPRRAWNYGRALIFENVHYVVHPSSYLWLPEAEVLREASRVGLVPVTVAKSVRAISLGRPLASRTRLDYLFRKV